MGQSGSKAADQGNAVTGRAVGITGGGALKRLAAPKLPQGAVKARPEDYQFIEVSSTGLFCPTTGQATAPGCHPWASIRTYSWHCSSTNKGSSGPCPSKRVLQLLSTNQHWRMHLPRKSQQTKHVDLTACVLSCRKT